MSENTRTTLVVAAIGAAGAIGAALIPVLLADKTPPAAPPPATIAAPPPAAESAAPITPAPFTKGARAADAVGKTGRAPDAPAKGGRAPEAPALTKAAIKAAFVADDARLQGRWATVEQQGRGKEFRPEDLAESRPNWTFHDDSLTIRHRVDGKMVVQSQGTYKLRRGAGGRKAFDFVGGDAARPVEFYGIYEFEGDSLKVCFQIHRGQPDTAPERPDAFAAGPGRLNLRLKRVGD